MKQLIFIFILLASLMSGCEHKEYDYYTKAMVSLQMPADINAVKVQGTVELKNLSNGRVYYSSDFNNNKVELEVLRGTYMLDAEGTIVCVYPDGHEEVKIFRASDNYIELVEQIVPVDVEIIFM